MDGYWIVLRNSGGELAREFVGDLSDEVLTRRVKELLGYEWILCAGDTISIEEGWSEQ